MGNSTTKESRSPPPYPQHPGGRGSSSQQSPTSSDAPYSPNGPQIIYTTRHPRGSRSELSTLFGISNSQDRAQPTVEVRRETKAEREARKLEKERKNREIERERSMREESVDGGYLVTQGVYTGIEDYSKPVVRQLMIDRRIAPFWRGLNDHSDSWTEHQLVAAARGKPIPAADEVPESPLNSSRNEGTSTDIAEQKNRNPTVPGPGKASLGISDNSQHPSGQQNLPVPNSSPSGTALLRGKAKTLASLTTSSKNVSQSDLSPREINISHDPYVNGQPIEAYLYKDASECPICFLYYPPYLNRTRCCDQPICSECFVQIKRPDPHPPEHADPSQPPPNPEEATQDPDGLLISEPAACPYCVQPEFGVTFDPLQFKRGLAYANPTSSGIIDKSTPPMSSSSSLASLPNSGQLSPQPATRRKRGISLSASSPQVITTDKVRPDWATKLANARAHAARRSAAATALHTAAYLMGGRNGQSSDRNFPGFGRRTLLRRGGSDGSPGNNGSPQLQMISLTSDRYGSSGQQDQEGSQGSDRGEHSPSITGPPRHSSRRNRVEDLEEMMMMEAIRLSLASEEERRRKEEKEAKKEAKRKEKEDKKAVKAARKQGHPYTTGNNQSANNLGSSSSASLNLDSGSAGKGKNRDTSHDGEASSSQIPIPTPSSLDPNRSGGPTDSQDETAQQYLERSRLHILHSPSATDSALPTPSPSYRPSHLRSLSNASSSASSLNETPAGGSTNASAIAISRPAGQDGSEAGSVGATPPASGGGLEPMFNFRSLTAMMRDEERDGMASPLIEHSGDASAGVSKLDLHDGRSDQGASSSAIHSASDVNEGTSKAIHNSNTSLTHGQNSPIGGSPSHEPESVDESGNRGSLGKAHEIAIERTEERREQGSV